MTYGIGLQDPGEATTWLRYGHPYECTPHVMLDEPKAHGWRQFIGPDTLRFATLGEAETFLASKVRRMKRGKVAKALPLPEPGQ